MWPDWWSTNEGCPARSKPF